MQRAKTILRFLHKGQEKSRHYPAFPRMNSSECCQKAGEQPCSFGFYPVTGRFSFLVSSTSYKPFDSKSFILCEHFHIWKARLRGSAADWWFCPLLRTRRLAFPHTACRIFSCRCRHPFGVHVTPAVSSHVVAMRHYIFTIKKLPSTGGQQPPITIYFIEHCGLTRPAHSCLWYDIVAIPQA